MGNNKVIYPVAVEENYLFPKSSLWIYQKR